jgi:hypothetical protein
MRWFSGLFSILGVFILPTVSNCQCLVGLDSIYVSLNSNPKYAGIQLVLSEIAVRSLEAEEAGQRALADFFIE